MKVSSGTRSTGLNSDRQVSLTITGLNNIDYNRTADVVMNVSFSRMGETMRLVHRLGGRITDVHVSGSPAHNNN
jgi:phycocyanin-associated rod protein